MSIIFTFFVVATALLSPPTEKNKLIDFYRLVQPPGFWGKTARKAGIDSLKSRHDLAEGIKLIILTGATCFLLLTGIGKLMVPKPDTHLIYPLLLIAFGLICVPFWYRKL